MPSSFQKRIAIVEAYFCSGFLKDTWEIFADMINNARTSARNIQDFVLKWHTTRPVTNAKLPFVRTTEVVIGVQHRIYPNSTKSV